MRKSIIIVCVICMMLPVILSACTKPHDHIYTEEITKQPTCTSTGIKTFTCTICGDSYTEEMPLTEHSFSDEITERRTA